MLEFLGSNKIRCLSDNFMIFQILNINLKIFWAVQEQIRRLLDEDVESNDLSEEPQFSHRDTTCFIKEQFDSVNDNAKKENDKSGLSMIHDNENLIERLSVVMEASQE